MPTYRFKCTKCGIIWDEKQNVSFKEYGHLSKCPSCQQECNSIPIGGSGVLLKGRLMNTYLECFPDQTAKLNAESNKFAEQSEKEHDAHLTERLKKEKDEES